MQIGVTQVIKIMKQLMGADSERTDAQMCQTDVDQISLRIDPRTRPAFWTGESSNVNFCFSQVRFVNMPFKCSFLSDKL